MDNELRLWIAGTHHHCDGTESDSFECFINSEPTNQYDPNAIGVYRKDDCKLIGYVPKRLTQAVRMWAGGDVDYIPARVANFEVDFGRGTHRGSLYVNGSNIQPRSDVNFKGVTFFVVSEDQRVENDAITQFLARHGAEGVHWHDVQCPALVVHEKGSRTCIPTEARRGGSTVITIDDFIAKFAPTPRTMPMSMAYKSSHDPLDKIDSAIPDGWLKVIVYLIMTVTMVYVVVKIWKYIL